MSSGTITKRISSSPSGVKYIDNENRLQWDKDKKDVLKKVWFNDRGVVEKDGEEEYNDLRDDTFINDDGSMNDYRNPDEERKLNDERFSSLPIRSRSAAASQRINLPPNEDNTSRSTYLKNAHLRLYADGQRRLQRQRLQQSRMSQQAFHEESPISSLGTRARRSAPNSAHLRLYADGQRRKQQKQMSQQAFHEESPESSLGTRARRSAPNSAHLRLYADGQRRIQQKQMSQQLFDEEPLASTLGARARRSAPNRAHLRLYADGQRRLQQQVFDDEPSVSSLITHLNLMNEADLDDFICFLIENDLLP